MSKVFQTLITQNGGSVSDPDRQKKHDQERKDLELWAWLGVGAVVVGLVQGATGSTNWFWGLCILVGPLVTIVCLVLRGQVPKS